MVQFELQNVEELEEICSKILASSQHKIFLLIGDLGAGKTTFTKHFVTLLKSEDMASSPTYSVINEYKLQKGNAYHIDLYRLNSLEEAMNIGIEDYLYSDSYCFIEWPELIKPILPNTHHSLEFHILDNGKRKILFS